MHWVQQRVCGWDESTMKKLFLISLIGGLLVAGLAVGWFYAQTGTVHTPQQSVELMIPKGAGAIKIAQLLEQHDVIVSRRAFRLKVRLDGSGGRLRSGLYRFDQPATMAQIIARLEQGDVMRFQVTVPEGLRTDEVIHLLDAKNGQRMKRIGRRLLKSCFRRMRKGSYCRKHTNIQNRFGLNKC